MLVSKTNRTRLRFSNRGGSAPIKRLLRRTFLAIVTLLAFCTFSAARKRPATPPSPAEVLATRMNNLVRKLYGLYLDQFEPMSGEIQKLVVDHLNDWISNRTPNFVEVREQIEGMFSKVSPPFDAESVAFQAPWKGRRMIIAGYTVGWSDTERVSTVVLYESQNGRSRQVALTHFLPRADLFYAAVPPAPNGDFRFIIWGHVMGMDHPRMSAALYEFDGQALKSLWEDQDVYDGRLQVRGNNVVIKYLNRTEYVRAMQQHTLPPRHEATYKLTATGLNLESTRNIPF